MNEILRGLIRQFLYTVGVYEIKGDQRGNHTLLGKNNTVCRKRTYMWIVDNLI
jgi:hypothetical protein